MKGCWTCILQKTSCTGGSPCCLECLDLGLASVCEYVRPMWWNNPVEKEERKEKIHTLIREHKNASLSKRVSPLFASEQASHIDIDESGMRSKPVPFPSINQDQRTTISPPQNQLPTVLDEPSANRNLINTRKALGEHNNKPSLMIWPLPIHRRKRIREIDAVGDFLPLETPPVTKRVHTNNEPGSDDDSQESSPHTTDGEDDLMTRF